MYRDMAQWSDIRDQILRKGVSIRQVVRETGISRETVRKMLDHPLPQPYRPRSRRYPKLGPHTGSVQRMLRENATLPPSARLSIKAIYERIRDTEGFRGSYGSVTDYARPIAPDKDLHLGICLRPADIAGKEARDRLPIPAIPCRPTGHFEKPHRAVFPRRRSGDQASPRSPTGASRPGRPRSSGCAPSSRRRSTSMRFAGRSAISRTSRPCLTASTTAACPTVTDPWSFSRTAVA